MNLEISIFYGSRTNENVHEHMKTKLKSNNKMTQIRRSKPLTHLILFFVFFF